ncbi:MAG: hypothetical protein ABI845_05755, partial [Polaromonas sp.]
MAEAEDVITDAARHATIYAQALWRRHRPASKVPEPLQLADIAPRLDLLIAAVFGRSFALRVAQAPAVPSMVGRLLLRHQLPPVRQAFPATDGRSIWLPATFSLAEPEAATIARFRTMALLQSMRAERGSAQRLFNVAPPLTRELYLLLEARAADEALARLLPGMAGALATLRSEALQRRPRLGAFAASLQTMEKLAQALLAPDSTRAFTAALPVGISVETFALPATPDQVWQQAQALSAALGGAAASARKGTRLLWRDWWTGELRQSSTATRASGDDAGNDDTADADGRPPRSARMSRRPEVREGDDEENDDKPGAWMVQTAQPHEQAEDPMGLQRPTDRDETIAAEDFSDALSELPEARLVSAPGKPKEILISDDPPEARAKRAQTGKAGEAPEQRHYPEWDWRAGCYRDPGATVLLLPAPLGPQQWVDDTLARR